MLVQRPRLRRLPVKVLAVRAARNGIVVPEQTALLQLGQQQLNDVLEGLREEGVGLRLYRLV